MWVVNASSLDLIENRWRYGWCDCCWMTMAITWKETEGTWISPSRMPWWKWIILSHEVVLFGDRCTFMFLFQYPRSQDYFASYCLITGCYLWWKSYWCASYLSVINAKICRIVVRLHFSEIKTFQIMMQWTPEKMNQWLFTHKISMKFLVL